MKCKIRNSSYELMRLILMFFIMWHHFIYAMSAEMATPVIRTADTFFHIAVLCFVILSGYFGIRFKLYRLMELITQVVFFSVVLTIVAIVGFQRGGWKDVILSFMPFTNGHYWFIAIYLQLFLLSPFINFVLERVDNKKFTFLILVLGFLIFYVGLIRGGNVSADGGKNIVNFIFLYCIGFGIKRFTTDYNLNIVKLRWRSVFSIVVVVLLAYFAYVHNGIIGNAFLKLIYNYHSPGLYIMSISFFLFFVTCHFQSAFINIIASSSLSIYLFHEHPIMKNVFYKDLFTNLHNSELYVVVIMIGLGLCLAMAAILLDQIRKFLNRILQPMFKLCEQKLYSTFRFEM